MNSSGVYIGQKIVHLFRQIDRKIGKSVAQYGITGIQAKIINFLFIESSKRDIFQKDIEERFNIRRSSVTSVLNLMEKNGYIERVCDSSDARYKKIILKEKGLELSSIVTQLIEEVENSLSEALTDEEHDIFINLINKLSKEIAD